MSNDSLIGTSPNRISNIACQHNLAHSHISQGQKAQKVKLYSSDFKEETSTFLREERMCVCGQYIMLPITQDQ